MGSQVSQSQDWGAGKNTLKQTAREGRGGSQKTGPKSKCNGIQQVSGGTDRWPFLRGEFTRSKPEVEQLPVESHLAWDGPSRVRRQWESLGDLSLLQETQACFSWYSVLFTFPPRWQCSLFMLSSKAGEHLRWG